MVRKILFMVLIWLFVISAQFVWGADMGELQSGQTGTGYLRSSDSYQDTWTFYGDTGDRVVISAARMSGLVSPCIYLYPPDGGPQEDGVCNANNDHTLDLQLSQTGLYTIIIKDYNMDNEGEYSVSLSKIPLTLRPGVYNPEPSNICNVPVDPELSWDAVEGATSYDVFFGIDVVEPLEAIVNNITDLFYSIENLENQTIYYWTVIAHTPSGDIPGTINWFRTLFYGDLNSDNQIDELDLEIFAADFGRADCYAGDPCEGDFNNDGDVDGSDLAVFAADFGRTDCPTSE